MNTSNKTCFLLFKLLHFQFICKACVLFWQVAKEEFSESTLGYRSDESVADTWIQAFQTPHFRVTAVSTFISPFLNNFELCYTPS